MKFLSGSLILLLFLHLQCGGSCLIEAFGGSIHEAATSTQPPCHKQGNPPSSDQQPLHDADSPCNQGQLIESRTHNSGKVVLEFAGVLPPTLTLMMASDRGLLAMTPGSPSFVLPPPVPISILRI
jgi:hypothetical protein